MPSTTPKMARTMAAAAHDEGFAKKMGIPQSVAREFNQADKGTGIMNKGYQGKTAHYAQGGAVLGKESSFMKTPDQFRDDESPQSTDENWGKDASGPKGDGGPAAPAVKGKSLKAVKPRG